METKIIRIDKDNYFNKILNYPAKVLSEGGLVAFPTETVYGLGANALDEEALFKIFEAKGRPADNPLIVHIANIDELDRLVEEYGLLEKKVISKFWPGPLTIVFKKKDIVPEIVTAGLDTVAIRMPSSKIARKLIELANVPVAAPSANLSGKPSPTVVNHVIEDLTGKVECIIDGGNCEVGLESTVLDLSGEIPTILRPGGVTYEKLLEVIPNVVFDEALINKDMTPKSPGMKYVHYSPDAEVYILECDDLNNQKIFEINSLIKEKFNNKKIGFMGSRQFVKKFKNNFTVSLGNKEDLNEIASNLFNALRKFDEHDVEVVISESFSNEGMGLAIMNRLNKSAGYKTIKI
ncbi:L-threonylcarbamoyladenylate synthase [Clostridiaceae bacterium HSG29]|nr:L-threonylcarbamoyladenylate synthase [Clostridiaceae bacterium HSG29]